MVLVCPRCQRTNPNEAVFCHFNGAELRPVQGRDEKQNKRLPHDFIFPSGRHCRTYEDLVRGCHEEWDAARVLLRQGVFRQFLAGAGRADLARAADEAKTQTDPDIALDTFLNSLPATVDERPRLDLNPRRLNLGTLHVGESRQLRLTVTNQGRGMLHGTLTVAEGNNWLRLGGNGKSNGECQIKTAGEQVIALRIDTRGLVAPHKYSAKLTVITNGGIVEVPVRLDLAVYPFPKAPFQGVSSPREMAERMRTQPKPAGPLLENGDVARWFAINGWTYPVLGPTAKGVAAVQQFFEGMGLSKPPVLQLSETDVVLACQAGEPVQGQVLLRTEAKKWVYGRVESDAPWLRVTSANVSGPQQAVIAFEVDSYDLAPGQQHVANLRIVANAGQTLAGRVRVDVQPPVAPPVRRARARPFVVGAAAGLVLRLLLAVPGDLLTRVLMGAGGKAGSFGSWLEAPAVTGPFVMYFVLATSWLGAVAGAWVLLRRGSKLTDLMCGVISGAMAGLAASATFACFMPALDYLPRLLWREMALAMKFSGDGGRAWLWTPLWIILATLIWTVVGAAAGFLLSCAGRAGALLLGGLGEVLAVIFRLAGMKRAAGYFALQ